jgi:hypothetical protein
MCSFIVIRSFLVALNNAFLTHRRKVVRFLGALCTLIAAMSFWIIADIDPSFSKITPQTAPDSTQKNYAHRPLTLLVSYTDGDEVFFQNQNMLSFSALNRGIDIIHLYRKSHMDSHFYHQHKDILTQPRGAGYWLWKPYFILKTMERYPDETILIYADSGVVFNQPVQKLLTTLEGYDRILVGQGKPAPLRRHLKKEVHQALKIEGNDTILNQQNIWGFFMVLRNNSKNRAYIKRWLELCMKRDLITDMPFDARIQESGFEYHQHDQSLLSVVEAQAPKDEKTLIIPKNILRGYGVHNYHRHPDQRENSPLLLVCGLPQWINDWFFSPLIRVVRWMNFISLG